MSVLIKGMEMPKNCYECRISQTHVLNGEIVYQCPFTGYFNSRVVTSQRRMNDCPLIELPPHGRLIDRSKLAWTPIDITDLPYNECLPVYFREDVDNAPTIIEAEGDNGNMA